MGPSGSSPKRAAAPTPRSPPPFPPSPGAPPRMLLLPETLAKHRVDLLEALEEDRISEAVDASTRLSAGRVAELLSEAPRDQVLAFLVQLPHDRGGEIVGALPSSVAADLLDDLAPEQAIGLFSRVRPEYAGDIWWIWNRTDPEWAVQMLAGLEPERAARVRELGSHEPGTAGAVMSLAYLSVPAGRQVRDVVDALRAAPPEVERSNYVYVLDEDGKVRGVLSIRDLFLAGRDETLDRIMNADVVAVRTDDDALDAARLLRNRRLKLLPVLEEGDRLVGVITRDDAFELLAEELAAGFARSQQASPDESFFTPPMGAVRRRLPWMGTNVFLNLGAVFVIASFENTIAQVAILAAFLPMITDMGGNVGIQALSVAIRSIGLGEARVRDIWRAVRKEVLVGLVNGAALGSLFAAVAWFLEANPWLGMVAGLALGVNVLVASVVGGSLPFIIKRFGKDPAMMTGPFLTTITDITGVTIYLGLSTVFLTQILG
ncbi:MAG: magnesium transporter [Gemmatimonadales bacterium]|nr:MAG: magnesium transporter [Gemmatimonadales bacterium]